jgi:hypothetical protein
MRGLGAGPRGDGLIGYGRDRKRKESLQMLRRMIGMARGRAMRGAMGGHRPGPRAGRVGPGVGPRAGRRPASGGAEIERGVRSIVRGVARRRRGL